MILVFLSYISVFWFSLTSCLHIPT